MSKISVYLKRTFCMFLVVIVLSISLFNSYTSVKVYATGVEFSALQYIIEYALASLGYSFSSQSDLDECESGLNQFVEKMKDSKEYKYAQAIADIPVFAALTLKQDVEVNGGTMAFLQNWLSDFVRDKAVDKEGLSNTITSVAGLKAKTYSSLAESLNYYTNAFNYSINRSYPANGGNMLMASYISFYNKSDNYYYIYYLVNAGYKNYNANYLIYSDSILKSCSTQYAALSGYGFSYDRFSLNNNSLCYKNYNAYVDSINLSNVDNLTVSTYKDLKIYNSVEEKAAADAAARHKPTYNVYGSLSKAKTLTQNEAGNYDVKVSETHYTAAVEKAVADALAANPSATDEELQTAASSVIEAQNATTDAVDNNTDAVNNNTAVISGLLSDIYKAIQSVGESVTQIRTDGTSALKEDVDDIRDQFKVVESNTDPPNDNNDDKPPSVWLPFTVALPNFLKNAVNYLAQPLSEITKFLDSILKKIENVPDLISEFKDDVSKKLSEIPENLTEFKNDVLENLKKIPENFTSCIEDLKLAIQNAIQSVIEALPAIDLSPLVEILGLIQSFFVLDPVPVSHAAEGFRDEFFRKFGVLDPIYNLFKKLNFSDSYDYPVIKMKTPDILSEFYSDEYIVIINFSDFSKQFSMVRNIVRAMIWVMFAYSIFGHFKVRFHIG